MPYYKSSYKKDYSILRNIGQIIIYVLPCYFIPLTVFSLHGNFEPNPLKWPDLNEKLKAVYSLENSINTYKFKNINDD